ncbi:MAG: hypothetical protein DRJ01_01070 [Bacteroidetes bacterium]|nr:MAG: hypothetical protein DRJ01_01070 [Bacteroidota bacterium]
MGSSDFTQVKIGQFKNAQEAFNQAVEVAKHMNGHGGYTGTIAEKTEFQMVPVPKGQDPEDFVEACMNFSEGKFWDDKWGPAGCVEVTGKYLKEERGDKYKGVRNFHVYWFFGYASC